MTYNFLIHRALLNTWPKIKDYDIALDYSCVYIKIHINFYHSVAYLFPAGQTFEINDNTV